MARANARKDASRRVRLDEVRAAFELGEAVYARQNSPLYATLCREAREDEAVLALAAHAREGQPPAFHLLSAVHFLLHDYPDDDLAPFFGVGVDALAPPEGALGPFRAFCARRADEIIAIISKRTIQSTSVERAAFVLPPLDRLSRQVEAPLHLIEVGCSAGLLLQFDRYAYDFGAHGKVGDGAIELASTMLGPHARAPAGIPKIAARVGIDLQPIDLADADERRWIAALIFPEWRAQGRNIARALDLAAASPPRVLAGSANDILPGLLAETPDPVCVFHSNCLYYFPPEAQRRFDEILIEAGKTRVVHRIGVETPPDYALQARRAAETGAKIATGEVHTEVTYTRYSGGKFETELWGRCHRYGAWFEWLV
ncbi:MAG: DUF2332 domain-containing protein [Hyphomonadaceae bacterium]